MILVIGEQLTDFELSTLINKIKNRSSDYYNLPSLLETYKRYFEWSEKECKLTGTKNSLIINELFYRICLCTKKLKISVGAIYER